jgi:hypothetical protein
MELYGYSPLCLQGKTPFFSTFICYNVLVSTSTGSVVRIHTVENYTHRGFNKSGRDISVSLLTSYR